MTKRRIFFALFIALIGASANAQSWTAAYEKGLKAARVGDWINARASFQQAAAYRPEDASGPTTLPGPVSDRRQWRDGAPYSPNFLAAYSEYRIGIGSVKAEDGKSALETAATEFEVLLNKRENSKETFFYLDQIYTRLGDTAKRLDIETRFKTVRPNFRVDDEVIAPVELSVITGAPAPGSKQGTGPEITIVRPGQGGTPVVVQGATNTTTGGIAPALGPVAPVSSKFALIVGNSTSQLKSGGLTFGSDDAQALHEALIGNAGYPDANVDMVINTSRDQLLASAKALADRLPTDGTATVFIYFAGNGANIDGKDYLAGVDSASESDPTTMVGKMDLYRLFMAKSARIYAFFEVPRLKTDGNYFGKEIPLVGSIAQVQSTIPGETVYSEMHNGRLIGVFTNAMVSALQDIRSNRIPIMEFGWQVFNRVRGGGTGADGAGARQVPTLPVLTHMSGDDRF